MARNNGNSNGTGVLDRKVLPKRGSSKTAKKAAPAPKQVSTVGMTADGNGAVLDKAVLQYFCYVFDADVLTRLGWSPETNEWPTPTLTLHFPDWDDDFLFTLLQFDRAPGWLRVGLCSYMVRNQPTALSSPKQFYLAWCEHKHTTSKPPMLLVEFAGEYYPVKAAVSYRTGFFGERITIEVSYAVDRHEIEFALPVTGRLFRSEGTDTPRTLVEVLAGFGLRFGTDEDRERYDAMLVELAELKAKPGTALALSGPVWHVRYVGWDKRLLPSPLGTPQRPIQVVAEFELEQDENQDNPGEDIPVLPLARIFDFGTRSYAYAPLRSLQPYVFDDRALERIAIDTDYRRQLELIFQPNRQADEVNDLVQGKHGGIIILASGPSGVGKTMTAEVVAQTTHRPLYTIGLADLGTNLTDVSKNLNNILLRAERWNALLLIDEADVIMARRGDDLVRSAIVGLFLHRIEYYKGFLFLTSNRPETLDAAVLNRVTLHRRYSGLTDAQRAQIWTNMLERAQLTLDGSALQLGAHAIDGRRIRNAVRLAHFMHPAGSIVTAEDLLSLVATEVE